MRTYRMVVMASAMGLLTAACAASSSGQSSIEGASTTTAPTSQATSSPAQTTTTAPPATTTTSGTTKPSVNVTPALIVANGDGAFLVDNDFMFQLVAGSVELALDDGEGGLVFQRSSDAFAFPPDPAATIISYLPADSFDPQELLLPTGEQYLHLRDAKDGIVWYTRRAGDTPDNTRETLRTYDLETRTVEQFAITGGWESGALEVSVGGTNVATYWSSEAATGFAFHSESGGLIGFPGNPYEAEQFCGDGQLYDGASGQSVDLPCYEFAELSDDGRLAYYEADFNGIEVRWILVVVDLESGKELFRQDVNRPDQGWKPSTIDLGENMALVNRTERAEWGAPFIDALLIDLESGTSTEVGVPGQARFLTGPMGIS